jgi:hypothetical protein
MTRDEVLNMPAGREMDALIAEKVMGWIYSDSWEQLVPSGHADPPIWSDWEWDIEELTYVKHPINMMGGVSYRGDKPYIPEYSTNISAAWKIVEKMINDGYDIVDIWHENVVDVGWAMEWIKDGNGDNSIGSDTAPLAICKAALLTALDD